LSLFKRIHSSICICRSLKPTRVHPLTAATMPYQIVRWWRSLNRVTMTLDKAEEVQNDKQTKKCVAKTL
jgi:hypothetical protein